MAFTSTVCNKLPGFGSAVSSSSSFDRANKGRKIASGVVGAEGDNEDF